MTQGPDDEYDVVVVGSGAAGLATAITACKHGLRVCVLEKEPLFGGTTARSGGVLWIPGNPVNQREGVSDSPAAARAYLRAITGNFFDAPKMDMFLETGPEMVSFFERETRVAFQPQTAFPDYRPDLDGASPGGRSIVAAPLDGRLLRADLKRLRPPLREITFVGMMFNASMEVQHFFKATKSVRSAFYVMRRLMAHTVEMARFGRAIRLTNGNALAGRLALSALDLGIPIFTDTPMVDLVMDGARVAGVRIGGDRPPRDIMAARGVVMAAGGFPLDRARRAAVFPHGNAHYSPAPPGNTGDGIRIAAAHGAAPQDAFPNAAAWIPVSVVQHRDGSTGHFPHLIDRYKPGIIAVNAAGQRFVNEAESYHQVGQAMLGQANGGDPFAWLICDHRALNRYGMGFVKPFPVPHGRLIKSGYLKRGRTLRDLAGQIGVPPDALAATVQAYNGPAAQGQDPQFGKGSTVYNRYLGDPEHRPNPCNAPLARGPFYAIRMQLGDLGTFGGLKTDALGRVLNSAGQPIAGLFAAGNDMASVMGGQYPGGGITLGPAMTFGYVIGRYLAGVADNEIQQENKHGTA